MDAIRTIIFYKQHFTSFYVTLAEDVRRKINSVLTLVRTQQHIPAKFFRQIEETDGLYEIRIEFASNIYRIFCCFDKGHIVVLFNGFQKKSQKTPRTQIEKAVMLMNEYFNSKKI